MAFNVTTLAKAAFKKAFGKAHTSNNKEIGNESIPSSLPLGTKDIFGQNIAQDPSVAVAQGVALECRGIDGLTLALDVTSTGKAYFAVVPSSPTHPLKDYLNPTTGKNYQTGDRVTRIIPQTFGDDYRPIILNGSTEVTPFAIENWVFDTVAGVLTSEIDLNLGATGKVECYVFVGQMLNESIGKQGAIALSEGAKTATVVFDEPFEQPPGVVQVQWCFAPNLTTPGIIPTVTVDQITREGFVTRWSHAVGAGYIIRWEAALLAGDAETIAVKAFLSPTSYGAQILAVPLDVLTSAVSPSSLGYTASFVQSHSSKTHGYFAGGLSTASGPRLDSIQKFSYSSESVSSMTNTLPTARSKGTSTGYRLKGFIAGGDTSSPSDLGIVSLSSSADSAQNLAISLHSASVAKGSGNDYSSGYIVLNSGDISVIEFVSETLSVGPNLGATDISTGCNDTGSGVAYFGRDTANTVTTLEYATSTVSAMSGSLRTSTTGRSCSFNSLSQAFFVGSEGSDQIDFATDTITAVSLGLSSANSAECTAVQSQGLL